MRIQAQYGMGVVCLPEKTVDMLADATGTELKLLIYILSGRCAGRDVTPSELAACLSLDENAVTSALSFWKSAGVIVDDREAGSAKVSVRKSRASNGALVTTVTDGALPNYTGEEIARLFESEPELGGFIDECQSILGRMFTPLETNKILALREYYGLSAEYIILLCGYCRSISRASVPYVEKVAKSFTDEDVVTPEALEEKIKHLEDYRTIENEIRRLCGMEKRALTAKEKKFIDKWTELGITPQLLELAYEVAVNNTGAPSMPYMNKVLLNWTNSGYKTAEDVFAGTEAYRKKKESSDGSFDTDEFFEAALRKALEKHKT